jgi:hypothetical protein
MALSLIEVLADPDGAARRLEHGGELFGVRAARGRTVISGAAILEMTLAPLPALAADGYPFEDIRVVVLTEEQAYAGQRALAYAKSGTGRTFEHRNPLPSRSLCLFYDRDDPALKWLPTDSIEEFVSMVRRHMIYEEYNRRNDKWPIEEAPHGPADVGGHPIRTAKMHALRHSWARTAP